MIAAFKKHIESNFSFIEGKKILLAISGGIDSVVLAHLFQKLKLEFALAHCNFHLRGKDSDDDEKFVKELGHKFNTKVFTKSFDTDKYAKEHKFSIQMAARELRYDWFDTLLKENQFNYIVTAHHLDDNLETFIINFIRGTGLSGLTGIPEINGKTIRPLLPFSREEIKSFAKENKIIWREDKSNSQSKYKRNKIRHQIIPLFEELNPNLLSSFKETSAHLKESQEIVNIAIEELKKVVISPVKEGVQKIDIHKIKELQNPKAYLFELLKKYGFTEWNDVTHLLEAQSGKQLFSKTHRLLKDRGSILLTELESEKNKLKHYEIKKDQRLVQLEEFKLIFRQTKHLETKVESKDIVFINMDKLQFPLQLRRWQKGDFFYPLGMKGKKKLSKFFKDEKFSLVDKENIWILCSANDIVWILGKRLDDRFKINNNTKNIVRLDLIKS